MTKRRAFGTIRKRPSVAPPPCLDICYALVRCPQIRWGHKPQQSGTMFNKPNT
jgi:hypothetical protein